MHGANNQNFAPPPPPSPNAGMYQKKTNGDFGKAFKWGSGISLGCLGPSCLGVVLIFSLLAGMGASMSSLGEEFVAEEKIISSGGRDRIAVIDIKGTIVRTADSSEINSSTASVDVIKLLDKAQEDKNVKAIVLDINSPGGYVSPTVDIYDKIQKVQDAGKKVVVSMGDAAASGGYYISSPADKIFAEKSTTTGSLGVIMTLMNFEGLFDKYGYEEIVIKSGELKDMGSWSRKMTDEERGVFQHFIDEAYDDFVKAIADGRGMEESKVRRIADGRIYTGTQAKDLGLVDEVGGFWDAVDSAEVLAGISDATVVEFSKQSTFKDEVLRNIAKITNYGINFEVLRSSSMPKYRYQWMP